jgi:hypothetical protein
LSEGEDEKSAEEDPVSDEYDEVEGSEEEDEPVDDDADFGSRKKSKSKKQKLKPARERKESGGVRRKKC